MVGWYDIGQLWRTGMDVLVSTFIGRHADQRLLEAMTDTDGPPWRDYTYHHRVVEGYRDTELLGAPEGDPEIRPKGPRKRIVIDYVADTGDGWNSTYAVAYALAHTGLCTEAGSSIPAERGDILVFGGDEVYPTASRREYKRRLILPYESALKRSAPEHPHVLAIPGNHDWYDSLVSFSRIFIGKEWFAGWFAPQDRSYFACRLPGNWWLLGVDTQLGADIDGPQVQYFERVAAAFGPDDKVILCCAEPEWIYAKFYSRFDAEKNSESNLYYLNHTVLKKRVRVFLSGDLHHYRRHADRRGVQKITCGGGGAFLHPTHRPYATYLPTDENEQKRKERAESTGNSPPLAALDGARHGTPRDHAHGPTNDLPTDRSTPGAAKDDGTKALPNNETAKAKPPKHDLMRDHPGGKLQDLGPDPFELKASYPSEQLSRKLTWRNLLFIRTNPFFGVLTGAIYLITVLSFGFVNKEFAAPDSLSAAFTEVIHALVSRPGTIFWSLLLPLAWVYFTDTHNPTYRWLAGGMHGTAHLLAAWLISFGAAHVTDLLGVEGVLKVFLARAAINFALGWMVGSFIMGLYLLISLNVFGRHSTEAFSALAIEDHKCFLRLCIDDDGALTIHPLKIDSVPRAWRRYRSESEERELDEQAAKVERPPLWIPDGTTLKLERIEAPWRVSRSEKEEMEWVANQLHGRPDIRRTEPLTT